MSFYESQKHGQINWWKNKSNQPDWDNVLNKPNWGVQNKVSYPHITKGNWHELLWKGIRKELPSYIGRTIKPHSGVHNLLSSWVTCANLYFPSRSNIEFKRLLLGFLQSKVSDGILEVVDVELEYALEGDLSPRELLGEMDGGRGTGQTSPDVAFVVKTAKGGTGLILTECKYTEHSFYTCSARKKSDRVNKPNNPHPEICMHAASKCDYLFIPCHQHVWGRKYLDHFQLTDFGKKQLTRCPAATAGYQLMRQQALANGILQSGKYKFVDSSVAFDSRNQPLINCLSTSGITDFQTGWSKIYEHGAGFVTWHHQDWVNYVRSYHNDPIVADWLKYMEERYGY
jgi:hypothetical protein